MREALPLAGKRIIITRPREQAAPMAHALEKLGATVSILPLIRLAEAANHQPLDEAISRLAEFDWLIFTSANAARYFTARCRTLGVEPGETKPRAAAIGPATASAAEELGWNVTYTSREYSAAALARGLGEELAGKKLLLPRSDRADSSLPDALRAAGAEVVSVVAYSTLSAAAEDAEGREQILSAKADVIVFASPSAVQSFVELFAEPDHSAHTGQIAPGVADGVLFAAIGPTTARALRQVGLRADMEAGEATAESLARAIHEFFEARVGSRSRQEA